MPALRRVVPLIALLVAAGTGRAEDVWRDPGRAPDLRARAAVAAMTLDEKIAIVHTHVGTPWRGKPQPAGAIGSAAVWPGVPRLGIPPQQAADGSLGVANSRHVAALYAVTALPSSLALAASFDLPLARAAGAVIGAEARAKGFGILLAGGANLIRDPRGGRSFEYASEDPLLTGRVIGESIAGIQSAGMVSTLKHFALNDQETGRVVLSADLREAAARESDLLAFQLALETGRPLSVMTSYNQVNGTYTSQNATLLATLKTDWRFPGFVMSDWGATHSTIEAALAGLDQESGVDFDPRIFFGEPLKAAVERGQVPMSRLDDMARRVLGAHFASGIADRLPRPGGAVDLQADGRVAERVAAEGIVLLKNAGDVLPLRADLRRIVVVGAHANIGVLSGGGSSQVIPTGSQPFSGEQPRHAILGIKFYHPSSPRDAIGARAPGAVVEFVDGHDHAAVALAARGADAVVVFAEQWMAESRDAPDLSLPSEQDQLIESVAAANPRTVVVLETGSAVTMPWLDRVPAVLEAWYSGSRGGDAIADVLFGRVAPSGRLPITFPRAEAQLPRPSLPGSDTSESNPSAAGEGGFDVDYDTEGADVGYKWFARQNLSPLFPFGFGLGYTRFSYARPEIAVSETAVTVAVDVRNDGPRDGTDVPQLYVEPEDRSFARRLAGWGRVEVEAGGTRRVTITVDPRLLARFDAATHRWTIAAGRYTLSVRANAAAEGSQAAVLLPAAILAP